jgi:hypothetical protein
MIAAMMTAGSRLGQLSGAEREALERFLCRTRSLLGGDLLEARIFGSRARGEGDEDSDIDVALVVTAEGRLRRREVYGIAFDVLVETGIDVAPLVIERERLEALGRLERRLAIDLDREGIAL